MGTPLTFEPEIVPEPLPIAVPIERKRTAATSRVAKNEAEESEGLDASTTIKTLKRAVFLVGLVIKPKAQEKIRPETKLI